MPLQKTIFSKNLSPQSHFIPLQIALITRYCSNSWQIGHQPNRNEEWKGLGAHTEMMFDRICVRQGEFDGEVEKPVEGVG